jgi:ankyrin repeat protein
MGGESLSAEQLQGKATEERAATDALLAKMPEHSIAGYPPIWVHILLRDTDFSTEKSERFLRMLRSIEDGRPEITRQLLPKFDPNHHFGEHRGKRESLLEWATVHAKHADCIRALLEAGANANVLGIMFRLFGQVGWELLADFLARGADPNERSNDITVLSACAMSGYVKEMKLLIDAGADLNSRGSQVFQNLEGREVTPLMIAASAGQFAAVKLLLASGADASATDASGRTALAWAQLVGAKTKREKVVALLQDAGLGPTAADRAVACQPDLAALAKSPEFQRAQEVAKELTKSAGKKVELAEGSLPGAKAFAIKQGQQPLDLLAKVREQLEPGKGVAVLSEGLLKSGATCLAVIPVPTVYDVLLAFETPEGQRLTSEELITWLKELHESQPLDITHVASDSVRARFLSELRNPLTLAKSIEAICSDVINEPIDKVAENLALSRELYLWWD